MLSECWLDVCDAEPLLIQGLLLDRNKAHQTMMHQVCETATFDNEMFWLLQLY